MSTLSAASIAAASLLAATAVNAQRVVGETEHVDDAERPHAELSDQSDERPVEATEQEASGSDESNNGSMADGSDDAGSNSENSADASGSTGY